MRLRVVRMRTSRFETCVVQHGSGILGKVALEAHFYALARFDAM